MVRVDVLINGERVDALALITHRDNSQNRGRELVEKMKDSIHASSLISPFRQRSVRTLLRDSTVKQLRETRPAKCYGGDISRKKKLLQKQKKGKKWMKQIGNVELPAGSVSPFCTSANTTNNP
ncbi:hypothetical protein ACNKHL_15815 [Shigella flexneri]